MPDKCFRVDMSYLGAMAEVNEFLAENPNYKVTHTNMFSDNGRHLAIVVCSPTVK